MTYESVLTVEGVGRRAAEAQRGVGALEEGVRAAARAVRLAVRLGRRAAAHHHLLLALLVLVLVLYAQYEICFVLLYCFSQIISNVVRVKMLSIN